MLHRPMSFSDWNIFVKACSKHRIPVIGVSNYGIDRLKDLINHSDHPPLLVQNELHPFIETQVPEFCKKNNIIFQAHSVMTERGRHRVLARKYNSTSAQVAISYALSRSDSVCFSTTCWEHLVENHQEVYLDQDDYQQLNHAYLNHSVVNYGFQGMTQLFEGQCLKILQDDVKKLAEGKLPSGLCLRMPKTRLENSGLSKKIAHLMFPGRKDPYCKFDHLMKLMRHKVDQAHKQKMKAYAPGVCILPNPVEDPEAMPMDIPDGALFEPMIQSIRNFSAEIPFTIKHKKGTLFSDGRLDLCKQGILPRFTDICHAVSENKSIKHFLIGNNISMPDEGNVKNFIHLIRCRPDIETWYLAGNKINSLNLLEIAAELESATSMNSLWLKMNPIKSGARPLGKLISKHKKLEVLDLFNTGLCDEGFKNFVDGIEGKSRLKHLYISINGLTTRSSGVFDEMLSRLPGLESLCLSVNMLKNEGIRHILRSLSRYQRHTLKCLRIGSNGLGDAILPDLIDFIQTASQMEILETGRYKSTGFFRGSENLFCKSEPILELIKLRKLKYLGIQFSLDIQDLDGFINDIQALDSMLSFDARQSSGKGKMFTIDGMNPNRFPVHLKNIESIYRTMAGKDRRLLPEGGILNA